MKAPTSKGDYLTVTIIATIIGLTFIGIWYLVDSSEDRILKRRIENHIAQIDQCRDLNGQIVLDEWGWFDSCIYQPVSP